MYGLEQDKASCLLLTQLFPDFVIPLGQLPMIPMSVAIHSDSEADFSGEVVPSGQGVQRVGSSSISTPSTVELRGEAYVPAGHGVQAAPEAAPSPEVVVPAGHILQCAFPVPEEYSP